MNLSPEEFARFAAEAVDAKERLAAAFQAEPHYEPLVHVFAAMTFSAYALTLIRDQFDSFEQMNDWFQQRAKEALREADHAAALDGTLKH